MASDGWRYEMAFQMYHNIKIRISPMEFNVVCILYSVRLRGIACRTPYPMHISINVYYYYVISIFAGIHLHCVCEYKYFSIQVKWLWVYDNIKRMRFSVYWQKYFDIEQTGNKKNCFQQERNLLFTMVSNAIWLWLFGHIK